jgi:hypothetical protein
MYRDDESNRFLEVTYQNGDKEIPFTPAGRWTRTSRGPRSWRSRIGGERRQHRRSGGVDQAGVQGARGPAQHDQPRRSKISGKKGERIVFIRTPCRRANTARPRPQHRARRPVRTSSQGLRIAAELPAPRPSDQPRLVIRSATPPARKMRGAGDHQPAASCRTRSQPRPRSVEPTSCSLGMRRAAAASEGRRRRGGRAACDGSCGCRGAGCGWGGRGHSLVGLAASRRRREIRLGVGRR